MKLTTEVECHAQIRATMSDDGTWTIRATATAVYDEATGGRTQTSLAVPVAEAGAVQRALSAALMAATQKAAPRVLDALSLTRNVARARGEIS
jgi:hypothetical protein